VRFTGGAAGAKCDQQTSDAYLFGLAIHKQGVLATFDTGIAALVEENSGYLKSLTILEA